MLISEKYRQLNKQLHAENESFGNDLSGWSKFALELIQKNGYASVLDYGCGKGKLAALLAENGITAAEYDPAVEGKDALPEPAELVVCTDVLEHIEPESIKAVLRHLRKLTQRRLFVVISCRPAEKTLADGRNAHLIVKPGQWWREKLLKYFQILMWEERGSTVMAELVAKKHMGTRMAQSRRQMPKEMLGYFEDLLGQINATSDAYSQIASMRMWEGIGDKAADLQAAIDIIHRMDDIDAAIQNIALNSLKYTFLDLRITDLISEADWRRAIAKRFRISQWNVEHDLDGCKHIMMIGAPGVMVEGIVAVGAVDTNIRWQNVETAIKRFPNRIELSDAHERTALIACYGPSLADTIEIVKREAARPDVDIISMSGSHDFLLSHGIVPTYHIECDPRLHKADHIAHYHPDVQYLVASVCHPGFFDKLGPDANIKLWHVSADDHVLKLLNEFKENPKHIISGGGSVGLRSIPLLYGMGYRDMSIFAMDCSYSSDGSSHAGKHAGKKQDGVEVICNGKMFISSAVLLTYATGFFEVAQKVTDLNIRLYGQGLLQSMCQYYMSEPTSQTGFMERIEHIEDEPALEQNVA